MWLFTVSEGTRTPFRLPARLSGLVTVFSRVSSLGLALVVLLAGSLLPRLWEESAGLMPQKHGEAIEPIYDFSLSDGEDLLLFEARTELLVRDSQSGDILHRRPLDRDYVWVAAWIPCTTDILLADSRGQLRRLDGEDSWTASDLPSPHQQQIYSLASTRDGRIAATGSADCLCLWNLPEERIIARISMHGTAPKCLQFSPGEDRLLVGCEDGSVRIYDAKDLARKHRFQTTDHSVAQVRFLDLGRKILGRGLWGLAFVLDASTGETVWKWQSSQSNFVGMAVSPDGKSFAISDSRNAISLHSATSFETIETLHGHDRPATALQFSQETGWLYSAGHDGTIRIWDTQAFAEMGCYQATSPSPNAEFSPSPE